MEGPPCPVWARYYPHGSLQAALPGNAGIGAGRLSGGRRVARWHHRHNPEAVEAPGPGPYRAITGRGPAVAGLGRPGKVQFPGPVESRGVKEEATDPGKAQHFWRVARSKRPVKSSPRRVAENLIHLMPRLSARMPTTRSRRTRRW